MVESSNLEFLVVKDFLELGEVDILSLEATATVASSRGSSLSRRLVLLDKSGQEKAHKVTLFTAGSFNCVLLLNRHKEVEEAELA
jgi:hypothetical protein